MFLKKKPFLEIIFLLAISALVYLPNIGNLTYFKDDWYYVYDGYIAGADVFRYMFSFDRPARGIFFEIYYSLFGPQPLLYHISVYLWRIFAVIASLWMFNLLWPNKRKFVFFITLLFALYPGYFWWISAIEYQPMIASLAIQVLSIALTLKAIQTSHQILKVFHTIGAILTGWIYIALVDYAIGMEVLRFLCVYVLVSREIQLSTVWKKLHVSIRIWIWNLFIPMGFIFWKIFIFDNQRKATDVGFQLSVLIRDPVSTGYIWLSHLFSSLLNLGMLAWTTQFQRFFLDLSIQDTVYGFVITAIVLFLVFLANKLINQEEAALKYLISKSSANYYKEALLIGVPGMVFGILPVVMANRYINLGIYSHYGLPASLSAAIFLTGLIYAINAKSVRLISFLMVILFAVLAHYSIAKHVVSEEKAIEAYWWQVSWRVPGLRPDTTLVTLYPPGIGGVDDSFMGIANMIYFPGQQKEIPVHYAVSVILPNNQNTERIVMGHLRKKDQYRSHTFILDYGNVLILSQPTSKSCVRVIDGAQYLLSESDPENIRLIASHSRIENIRLYVDPHIPQEFAFGAEPAHEWCYYFEKADLAVQQLDWEAAAQLGDEVIGLGLQPMDQAEWFPFLQAYSMLDDESKVKTISAEITEHQYLSDQICFFFDQPDSTWAPSSQMKSLITSLFCD